MLDFPNSPTNGQTFTAPNGTLWQWDGTKWISIANSQAYLPLAGGTLTGPLTLAGDPTTPLQSVTKQYADANAATNANALAQNIGRNFIHNGLFTINQRASGTITATGGYPVDRWIAGINLDTASFTQTAILDGGRAGIGDESATWILSNNFTGNAGTTAFNDIETRIENVRRLAGKTVTVSFWATASAALNLGVQLVQNMGTGGTPSANVALNGQRVALAASSWARYAVTFTLPTLQGMTLGTAGNDFTALRFWYSGGANNNTASGGVGVQTGTVNIWGMQLEVGSVATPLEKRDPMLELSLCQRMFQASNVVFYGYGAASTTVSIPITLSVTMRAAPTIVMGTPSANSNLTTPRVLTLSGSATTVQFSGTVTSVGQATYVNTYTASADL